MRTACGTGLPPGLLAEIHGVPGRLEPGVAGLKAVEADRAAALRPDREAAAREARDVPEAGGAAPAVEDASDLRQEPCDRARQPQPLTHGPLTPGRQPLRVLLRDRRMWEDRSAPAAA